MASPSAPAEAASVPATVADAAADFENFIFGEEPPEDDEDTPSEGTEEGDDLDLNDEEADEPEGEPEAPAIAPPASLNAEEKATFAQLPEEAQRAWAASETRRNGQVQDATTKASQAQREAESRAATADAQAKSLYGQQLESFVKAFEPTMPDPQLAYSNPPQYIAEQAQYVAMKAQHDALVQQVRGVQTEAQTQASQAFVEQRDRELMTIPEVANPDTRSSYLDKAMGVAEELGFDKSELSRTASASDIKALATIAEWKAESAKYRQALSKQMQKVRAAKGKTLRPNAAPHADPRAARGNQDWNRVVTARSKEAKAEAFADWFGL